MPYWLIKSPFRSRSWADVLVKGAFKLYGIRNHQAKNHIAKMNRGDRALYYHGPSGKQIYGVMRVVRAPYPDPTTTNENWLAVDFEPIKTFEHPLTLAQVKADPDLQSIPLLNQPRLSVMRLEKSAFEHIANLGEMDDPTHQ